jgi:hypothetical protein
MFHRVGLSIDKTHGIASDGNNREGLVIWREAKPMDKNLAPVERTEIAGLRVSQPDGPYKGVVGWIGHRDRIGELLGRVYTVSMRDGDIRVRRPSRRLTGKRRRENGSYDCD